MFIVFDNRNNKLVTRMSPEWQSGFNNLHALANSGQLVCPWCKHKLWFREKSERCRSCFAHRSVFNCPYSCMSDEKSEAVAQLYDWLSQQRLEDVRFAVDMQIKGWNWPADVVVGLAKGKKCAYWVFDRTPKNREAVLTGMPKNVKRHVLYTMSVRKLAEGNKRLILSAGQRDFIDDKSDYDTRDLGHLYFIDPLQHKVWLYRGLRCKHANEYACEPHELPLSACRVSLRNGEIVAREERELVLNLDDV